MFDDQYCNVIVYVYVCCLVIERDINSIDNYFLDKIFND